MVHKANTNNILLWSLSIALRVFAFINQSYISYSHIFLQFIITILSMGIAIFLCLRKTAQGVHFAKYWLESVEELKKVIWPSKKEIIRSTFAVLIMVVVMGLILWTVDTVLIRLIAWLLHRGG